MTTGPRSIAAVVTPEPDRGLYPTRTAWEESELFAFLTSPSQVQNGRCPACGAHARVGARLTPTQPHRFDCPLVPR